VGDYIRLTNEAVDVIRERSGFYKIHIMGQCQGGWQAAIYTSFYQEKIASLVTAAAPIDVNAASSEIVRMAQESPVELYEMMVALSNGRMNGLFILLGFKSMQAEEHYVRKYFKLWNLIKNNDQDGLRRFIFFEGWYDYTQFLPGKFYLEVIKNIFIDNKLTKPGAWVIDGRPVDLKNINCPVIILAGTKDHITPPGQAFALKNFISTPEEDVVEILTNGGHIGTLMGTEALREDWTAVAEVLELSI
jgi:poly(3-hydroxyalkanoate) synthetase